MFLNFTLVFLTRIAHLRACAHIGCVYLCISLTTWGVSLKTLLSDEFVEVFYLIVLNRYFQAVFYHVSLDKAVIATRFSL